MELIVENTLTMIIPINSILTRTVKKILMPVSPPMETQYGTPMTVFSATLGVYKVTPKLST